MTASTDPFAQLLYPYRPVVAQSAAPVQHPVIVIGAGPTGLSLALDLAQRGTPVLVLDDQEGVGQGSRAICFAKRTLEIADRLGAGAAMLEKGVVWNVGKVFHRDRSLFEFNLLPEDGHKHPAFINLQQPYFEKFLFDAVLRAQAGGALLEIRGRNRVTGLSQTASHVCVEIETPDGRYTALADYVVACDGARSPARDMLGLGFEGRVFEDNFLIADIRMEAPFPTERWFWFEPAFEGAGQSALLHKQPDNIWRVDFQLGWDIDRAAELDPDRIRKRVDAMLSRQIGHVPDYALEWTSIYTFQCRRMERFREGRVFFAGDCAHQVSPFGARGANSGVQDAENLAWKLDLVQSGQAPEALLDSYNHERVQAADENILHSTRSTDFLTPKSDVSKLFRDAVLALAGRFHFARPLVNSGRLSLPSVYDGSPLNGPDMLAGPPATRPGAPCVDAPLEDGHLLERLTGRFAILVLNRDLSNVPEGLAGAVDVLHISTNGAGALHARYLGDAPHGLYLIRPDQHVVARWADAGWPDIRAALQQATATKPVG
jgi:3-(3-hydroxy-phenyl)propionate hydroxylase